MAEKDLHSLRGALVTVKVETF